MNKIGILSAAAFVATVWAANYAVQHWGFWSVGFGYEAPAGVYFAGLAFTLRDIVHRLLGREVVILCILFGALLSYLVEAGGTIPGGHVPLALASAIAFLVSELSDMAIYEPARRRGWLKAVTLSNAVGLVVDSALFIWLALGWHERLFIGQVLGKSWMTLAAIAVLWAAAQRRRAS